eukprot:jgi/Chrzof1/2905/Cz12g03140.t1
MWLMGCLLAGPSARSAAEESRILELTDSLRLLETERDEAVSTAESCARNSVRLEEMVGLLQKLAAEKVTEGDEQGARQVLKEKAAVREIYDKNNTRAQTNFALAAKLADKIGAQQAELMQLLQKGTTGSSSSSRPTTAAPTPSRSNSSYSYSQSSSSSSSTASNSNSDTASSSITGSSQPYQAPWERSLAEAKQRLKTLEQEAVASGSRAQRTAQESIEEARQRLRASAIESVSEARGRIRKSAVESISEARQRIAQQDAAMLARVHELVARYRRGEYVPESEIEWAFKQLETRVWRH